ncbi:hypothetical protein RIF29_18665 [Crotalaria pallida]|uniref:Uncharacterized protein n=1 Tax=Crotalaria pallida TaxID=3830 RepID=A0AAN9F0K1_CROPI
MGVGYETFMKSPNSLLSLPSPYQREWLRISLQPQGFNKVEDTSHRTASLDGVAVLNLSLFCLEGDLVTISSDDELRTSTSFAEKLLDYWSSPPNSGGGD